MWHGQTSIFLNAFCILDYFSVCYFWSRSQLRLKSITAYRIITHFSRWNKGRANNSIWCNVPPPTPLHTCCWVKCEVMAKLTAGTTPSTGELSHVDDAKSHQRVDSDWSPKAEPYYDTSHLSSRESDRVKNNCCLATGITVVIKQLTANMFQMRFPWSAQWPYKCDLCSLITLCFRAWRWDALCVFLSFTSANTCSTSLSGRLGLTVRGRSPFNQARGITVMSSEIIMSSVYSVIPSYLQTCLFRVLQIAPCFGHQHFSSALCSLGPSCHVLHSAGFPAMEAHGHLMPVFVYIMRCLLRSFRPLSR